MASLESKLLIFFRKSDFPGAKGLARLLLFLPRIGIAAKYLLPDIKLASAWLVKSRETDNFSYNLTSLNKLYLANAVSVVTGVSVNRIRGYIQELDENKILRKHVAAGYASGSDRFRLGPLIAYGRRAGWYAIVRAVKPRVVVETGVDQGLGSCIIAEALSKNTQEGKPGKYFGTDIMPEAGSLFNGKYRKYGEILYGDSIKSLKKLNKKIDVFINDSDHSREYEAREYGVVEKLLTDKSVILGDNSHTSPELCKFAQTTNRKYIFFKEQPGAHWYEGAGIGIAYRN